MNQRQSQYQNKPNPNQFAYPMPYATKIGQPNSSNAAQGSLPNNRNYSQDPGYTIAGDPNAQIIQFQGPAQVIADPNAQIIQFQTKPVQPIKVRYWDESDQEEGGYKPKCCDYSYFELNRHYGEVFYNLVLYQLPFVVTNLLLALFSPKSDCMDKSYELGLAVRTSFFSTSIIDVALLLCVLIAAILKLPDIIHQRTLNSVINLGILISVVKSYVWAIVQIYLFHRGMAGNCSGSLHVYGIILVIAHYLQLVCFTFMMYFLCVHLASHGNNAVFWTRTNHKRHRYQQQHQ